MFRRWAVGAGIAGRAAGAVTAAMSVPRLTGHTRGRSFDVKRDPNKPWTHFDDLNADHLTDMNEFRPDKAIGLASVIDEMPPADVALRIRLALEAHSPAHYAFALFDSVDIYRTLKSSQLISRDGSVASEVSRWLMNPTEFFRDPGVVAEAMGEERWRRCAEQMRSMLSAYDEQVAAIPLAVRRFRLPADVWVPLLRWLVSEGCEGDFKSVLASFAVSLAGGRGPPTLMLPKDRKQRTVVVAQLLIAAAKEFGRPDVASLACEMMVTVGEPVKFTDQKNLMQVMARAHRRNLDWQLRHSGRIRVAIEDWNKSYLRTAANADALGGIDQTIAPITDEPASQPAADEAGADARDSVDEEEDAAAVTDFARGVALDDDVVGTGGDPEAIDTETGEAKDARLVSDAELLQAAERGAADAESSSSDEPPPAGTATVWDERLDELLTHRADAPSADAEASSGTEGEQAAPNAKRVVDFFEPTQRTTDVGTSIEALLAALPTTIPNKKRPSASRRAPHDHPDSPNPQTASPDPLPLSPVMPASGVQRRKRRPGRITQQEWAERMMMGAKQEGRGKAPRGTDRTRRVGKKK